jgi:hypothetical protein
MVAMMATSQKVKQACELAAVRLRPEGWASRAPFLTAPARRPRALAAGVGRFSCHGHHGHDGHPLPPEGWASRAPFSAAPARRPRALLWSRVWVGSHVTATMATMATPKLNIEK